MGDRQYHMKFGGSSASSVDAYLEYKRIVGDDDGGVLFTPEQYEQYKKNVLPMRLENRLFVSWTSVNGMDCKLIGPETQCFCEHRFRQHKTDFAKIPEERPVLLPCKVKGCRCVSYEYVPLNGSQPVRCSCKHFPEDHKVTGNRVCKKERCGCEGFRSSWTCGCGEPAHTHHMLTETKQERSARGHPVGHDVPYQAMGGITGFSSLMDGYLRLDPSGVGAPSKEFLEQPITSSDHPFLRANVTSIKAHKMAVKASDVDGDLAERMSAMRRPDESDMDYFERRYQERQRAEKARARNKPALGPGNSGRTPTSTRGAPSGVNMAVTGTRPRASGSKSTGTKKKAEPK